MTVIPISTDRIHDWRTFHDVFAETLGFPDYYGRNLDAWQDCMFGLRSTASNMTKIVREPGTPAMLRLDDAESFRARCPDQFQFILESCAELNRDEMDEADGGNGPFLALLLC